jgi:hypothetical protein
MTALTMYIESRHKIENGPEDREAWEWMGQLHYHEVMVPLDGMGDRWRRQYEETLYLLAII